MKTKKNLTLIVAIFAMFLLIGCEKNNSNLTKKSTSNDFPHNSNNIYDDIGSKHNSLLDDCRNKTLLFIRNNPDSILNLEKSIEISNSILLENDYDTTGYASLTRMILSDTSKLFSNTIENLSLSPFSYTILTNLIEELDSLAMSGNKEYVNYKSIVVNYEDLIIKDSTLTDVEKFTLLSSTSIMRHSLYYWSNNESYCSLMTAKAKVPKWIRAVAMAVCDVAGGIAGGVVGAVSGGSAGAVDGAIKGAVTASNGVSTLIDNIEKI